MIQIQRPGTAQRQLIQENQWLLYRSLGWMLVRRLQDETQPDQGNDESRRQGTESESLGRQESKRNSGAKRGIRGRYLLKGSDRKK